MAQMHRKYIHTCQKINLKALKPTNMSELPEPSITPCYDAKIQIRTYDEDSGRTKTNPFKTPTHCSLKKKKKNQRSLEYSASQLIIPTRLPLFRLNKDAGRRSLSFYYWTACCCFRYCLARAFISCARATLCLQLARGSFFRRR